MPMPTNQSLLTSTELRHELGNDPAYLAIIDLERYAKNLPDWDYGTLTAKLVADMNEARVIAWGTPEANLRIRLTTQPLDAATAAAVNATTRGRLKTTGRLCLANYTSLTMCAQFEKYSFPHDEDLAFALAPGTYDVEVHRLFAHADGAQDPDEKLPAGDHYVVVFTPASADAEPVHATSIAWALAL